MRYLLILAIASTFSSCSFFIKKIGGIKNPKPESIEDLNTYAKSIGIDPKNLVFTKDTAALAKLNYQFQGNPEILVFDKNKVFYPYKEDSKACNASIESILGNVCSINDLKYQTARNINYDIILSNIVDSNHALENFDLSNYDFIIFFDFAKYTYGLNKTHITPWIESINKNQLRCKVKYVYIDLDYMNTWGLKKKDLPKIKVKL